MRKDFISRYNQFVKAPISVLRHMFKELVHDSSAAASGIEQKVDERVAEALVRDLQDPEIIIDLRRNNGKVQSSFEDFWAELQNYLDEIITPVNERRHGDTMYLPIVISVRNALLRNSLMIQSPFHRRSGFGYNFRREILMPAVPCGTLGDSR